MKDPHTQESRGFGFVKMVTAEEADAAKDGLQGENVEGRTLSIEKARRARPRTPTPGKYFGPPKRGKYPNHSYSLGTNLDIQKRVLVVRHVVAALIVTKIVAVDMDIVATVAAIAATTTAIALAMMIVSVVPMDVVTTMALGASTVMPLVAATIATAAVVMTIVGVLSLMVEIVGVLRLTGTPPQGKLAIPMEVETKTTVLMIGTPVVRLRSANSRRCGALGQITRPNLSSNLACFKTSEYDTWRRLNNQV